MPIPADPRRPADAEARTLARRLMAEAHTAALAFLDPDSGLPSVSRIGFGLGPNGQPLAFLSAIALHTAALHRAPACALLIGDPPSKGDPLAGPRLSLQATAEFLGATDPGEEARRNAWLASHPKAALYIDLPDFRFVRFRPLGGLLNGGFGKAFHIRPADLLPPS